ncbi:hypothetical protein, partial [Pseudomonas aeruginosa]|uniref:hypothetical protein n=1 Tax=Pseudomonas aeruginosa TaxID=287 RepID=UPI003891F1EE
KELRKNSRKTLEPRKKSRKNFRKIVEHKKDLEKILEKIICTRQKFEKNSEFQKKILEKLCSSKRTEKKF